MKYIFLLLIIFLVSCGKNSQETKKTSNKDYDVELLFKVDGCSVYRFKDGDNYKYFTNKGTIEEIK